MSFWAADNMAEEEEDGLQDHIAHWMEVLDDWVKRIDLGLGRQDGEAISLDGAVDGGLPPRVDEAGADGTKGVDG
jgi:hypothetical protein